MLADGLLDAALDAVREPAFVLEDEREVPRMNRAGQRLLERRPETDAELRRVARGESPPTDARVTRLAGAVLVVMAGHATEGLAARAQAQWKLSPRQEQVVALLAEGRSNRAMAALMDVTERTIEQHLSALYARAQVDGRTELLAALLRI